MQKKLSDFFQTNPTKPHPDMHLVFIEDVAILERLKEVYDVTEVVSLTSYFEEKCPQSSDYPAMEKIRANSVRIHRIFNDNETSKLFYVLFTEEQADMQRKGVRTKAPFGTYKFTALDLCRMDNFIPEATCFIMTTAAVVLKGSAEVLRESPANRSSESALQLKLNALFS